MVKSMVDIDWICIKCGKVHGFISDTCMRCGWDRPEKKETKEERQKRWTEEMKKNRKKHIG